MSVPFAVSLVVHRVKNGPEWQDPATLRDKKILAFMEKVSVQAHPEFERVIKEEPASRIGKVDVIARGKKFSEERKYRKGSPATVQSRMTNAELVAKFQHNAVRVLPSNTIGKLSDMVLHLEDVEDVSYLAQMW
mgnify:FL=1